MGNEKYVIKIEAPLIRPGITIRTEVSQRYVVQTLRGLLDLIREFNDGKKVDENG